MEGLQGSRIQRTKTMAFSTGFDFTCDDDGALDFDMCGNDDVDLEEDYLTKLKTQRERMEKLEKCYLQKENQLSKEVVRTNQLLAEIQRLTAYTPYKQKYEELSLEYSELLTKYNIQQNQLQLLKNQLNLTMEQNGNTILRLKNQLITWRETSAVNANQLEESISDREEEVRKIKREWKDKEDQMNEEIKGLRVALGKLRGELDGVLSMQHKDNDKFVYEIKSREAMIIDLEKALEHCRKQNLEMKNDISKYSQQVNNREHQLTSACAKLKHQLNLNKKTLTQKDSKTEQYQSQIRKLLLQLQQLKKQNEEIKIEFKKSCEMYECGNKKLKYETDSEIGRLEAFIKELKDSIEELMEVKNHLMMENRKLVAILKKKEIAEKQRKQLLRTQFKEIDRIEKVIDRLE